MSETIGNRICKFRKEKSMTQEDLAEKIGVSSQAVSKWENDASCPDISLLPQLACLLGVSVNELLTGNNNEVRVLSEDRRKSLDKLIMRVNIHSAQGDKIRVNLPLSLVKVTLEMGMALGSFHNIFQERMKDIDLTKIIELAEKGVMGRLVEIKSAEGDVIEVVIE